LMTPPADSRGPYAPYDRMAAGYVETRRADPRLAAELRRAIGDAHPLLNVGAGAGSYEAELGVDLALEPSLAMIRRRPRTAAPCLQGLVEALPLGPAAVDTAVALLTMHHWSDWRAGVRELRRVAGRRIVLFTWDPACRSAFWFGADYLPATVVDWDTRRFPPLEDLLQELPGARVTPLPVPWDCIDGFLGAYWRRPHAYLDHAVRAGISSLTQVPQYLIQPALERLAADLASGAWHERHRDLLEREELDLGYRIVVADI
jgi:SAM-dependent methyltransferase